MKKAVYFCTCGGIIAEKIDAAIVERQVEAAEPGTIFKTVELACSEEGLEFLEQDLRGSEVERVVIAACSPRDHESTFRGALARAGINPYLMQMVNVREHVAWVTADRDEATEKAARLICAALRRVELHERLEKREIDICPDAVVIGAGPAGLRASTCIASAGRKVTLVEKSPLIGGMPVRYDELFPTLECGPCMIEPIEAEVLHGDAASNIEILTLSEVVEVVGSYGNFTVKIRQRARYVDPDVCIGCAEVCSEACPEAAPNEFDGGLGPRKAISIPFLGALPNVPFIDTGRCLRFKGDDCTKCRDACPAEGAIRFDDVDRVVERAAGAIVVAIGGELFEAREIPGFAKGLQPDVISSAAFERMLSPNGPTAGEIRTAASESPKSLAIVHCVGSLDENYRQYCSGICCEVAFKFNHLIRQKLPGAKCYHLVREIVTSGKEGFRLAREARESPDTAFVRYRGNADIELRSAADGIEIHSTDDSGRSSAITVDMAVLCPASIPAADTGSLSAILDVGRDRFGFFEERHNWTDAVQSTTRGIFIAGACQAPTNIQSAMNQGLAAAGHALAGLVPGRKLEISPVHAIVNEERCSGCRVCISICPYKALSFDGVAKVARVDDVLCTGCGTCVAGCPSGSIRGNHFTNDQILAEIEGLLA